MNEIIRDRETLIKYLLSIETKLINIYGETHAMTLKIQRTRKAIEQGAKFTWNGDSQREKALDKLLNNLANETKNTLVNNINHIDEKEQLNKTDIDTNQNNQSTNGIEASDNLLNQTAELNNLGIELEKQNKIEDAIKVYEDNIALGGKGLHSFDRLLILYHKAKDYVNEKRVIFRAREVYGNETMYEKRLEKLNGTYIKPKAILPICANPIIIKPISLGKQYEELKLKFPEFDFYSNTADCDNIFMNSPYRKNIWEIHSIFGKIVAEAEIFEEKGNYKDAAIMYEKLVCEEYYLTKPYDRLIKIYNKANLKSDEVNILNYSIAFFKRYRELQKEYVLSLARKYNKEDIALDYINNNKKIFYYGGAFELYNPNTKTLCEWEKRLAKCLNS